MSFAAAEANFHGARPGRASTPGCTGRASARSGADELVLRHLLPLAHAGLADWGVSDDGRGNATSRHRGPGDLRASTARPGRRERSERFEERGQDRITALRNMLEAYVEHMHTNEPVHTWPLP